jgi:hypothetical protein
MRKPSITAKKWLIFSLIPLIALVLALVGPERSVAHHSWPTTSPLPTPTPTPSPTPVRQACQVEEVVFDQDAYTVGEPIGVTLRVVDFLGEPLIGANVWVEVNRQELSVQSSDEIDSIDLDDRSGYYEGVYDQTDLTGEYTFTFTVVDPTGERFLPCSAEESVPVEGPDSQCQISVTAADTLIEIGDPITLTTEVTVDGASQSGAQVTATVGRPDNIPDDPIAFAGDGPYIGVYANTDLPGIYTFEVSASDLDGEYLPCSAQLPVEVIDEPTTPMVRVDPERLETTLCDLRRTTLIKVEDMSNLTGVELEVTYDPDVIQVIDAEPGQRGVQVRRDPVFDTASIVQNAVDTRNGRIFFAADLLGGQTIAGDQNLIAIDWRPQQVGTSPVVLARVVLRDAAGQPLEFDSQDGSVEVMFVSSCAFGVAALQQRTDHGGIVVTNNAGYQTVTLPDGSFGIPANETIDFAFPSYLSARADLRPRLASEQAKAGEITAVDLGTVTLLAGDVNGDDVVNILDVAHVANNFLTKDPAADLNADGLVNIFDLVVVASNYRLQGPLAVP